MVRRAGSTTLLSINGIPFPVAADADIGEALSQYTKEVMMTSGDPMLKVTLRNRVREGFKLLCDAEQKEQLVSLCDSLDVDQKFIYGNAARDQYHCVGTFAINDNATSQDNAVTISIHPIEGNDWQVIKA
jgi:hypothetical protein